MLLYRISSGLFPRVISRTCSGRKKHTIYTNMILKFDDTKSNANNEKHGLDFVEAQALWNDVDRIEIPARTEDEPRFLMIGRIAENHWSAVITYRGENVRIISVRRARVEEVVIYEGRRI